MDEIAHKLIFKYLSTGEGNGVFIGVECTGKIMTASLITQPVYMYAKHQRVCQYATHDSSQRWTISRMPATFDIKSVHKTTCPNAGPSYAIWSCSGSSSRPETWTDSPFPVRKRGAPCREHTNSVAGGLALSPRSTRLLSCITFWCGEFRWREYVEGSGCRDRPTTTWQDWWCRPLGSARVWAGFPATEPVQSIPFHAIFR